MFWRRVAQDVTRWSCDLTQKLKPLIRNPDAPRNVELGRAQFPTAAVSSRHASNCLDYEPSSRRCVDRGPNTTPPVVECELQPCQCTRVFTGEETFGAQEADAEPQDGELVQAGDDVLRERQQARQAVQLRVQTVTVAFGRVGLGAFSWGRFDSGIEGLQYTA